MLDFIRIIEINLLWLLLTVSGFGFIKKYFKSYKINNYLLFPFSFFIFLGFTTPIVFLSYLFNLNFKFLLVFYVILIVFLFRYNIRYIFQLKSNFKKYLSKINLFTLIFFIFLIVNVVLFIKIPTFQAGDSAFHVAKINYILKNNVLTNKTGFNNGAVVYEYLNNGYHPLFAAISYITKLSPIYVWSYSFLYFRILMIISISGLFYQIFKNNFSVLLTILFSILCINSNTSVYPAVVQIQVGFIVLLTVLSYLLDGKFSWLFIFVLWGISCVHYSLFSISFVFFVAFFIQKFINKTITLKDFVFIFISVLPFLLTILCVLLFGISSFNTAININDGTTREMLSFYSVLNIRGVNYLFKNIDLFGFDFLTFLIGAFLFYKSKNTLEKFILFSYFVYQLTVFTPISYFLIKIIPYWSVIRLDRIFNVIPYLFLFWLVDLLFKIKSINKNNGLAIASICLVLIIMMSSNKLIDLFRYSRETGSQMFGLEKRFLEYSQYLKEGSLVATNGYYNSFLPTVLNIKVMGASNNLGLIGEDNTKLINEAIEDTEQNAISKKYNINYVVLNNLSKKDCDNYNVYWTDVFYKNNDCILKTSK